MRIKEHINTLRAVWRDPRTPWYAKAVLAATAAYLVSPIDLIPDFVPVVGYLDDVLVAAIGLFLARLLVPRSVWEEAQKEARIVLKPPPDAGRNAAGPTPRL